MPSIINASSSGSGGLVQTADASGVLQLQSNGTLAVSISGATTTLSGNMVVNNQVSSSGDLNLDAVFSVMIKKSGSTNATINQFGIGLAGSNLSSGIGLAFPATQSASSDANTLDDYEEGTWSPTVSGATNTTGTPTISNARYTKIGNLVSIEGTFLATVTSSNQVTYWVFTLPFVTVANGSGACGSAKQENVYIVGAVSDATFSGNTQAYLSFSASAQLPSGSSNFSFSLTYIAA
jgi:hypothetical protein